MEQKNPPKNFMFRREYAEYRNVHLKTVEYNIREGRVVYGPDNKRIDVRKTDEIWDVLTPNNEARRIIRQAKRDQEKADASETEGAPEKEREYDPGPAPVEKEPSPMAKATQKLQESRADKEIYQAKIKQLEWEEKAGSLISKEAAMRHALKVGSIIRDRLRNIPQKVAAELAAETDLHQIEVKLLEEIDLCLEGLRDLKKVGKQA